MYFDGDWQGELINKVMYGETMDQKQNILSENDSLQSFIENILSAEFKKQKSDQDELFDEQLKKINKSVKQQLENSEKRIKDIQEKLEDLDRQIKDSNKDIQEKLEDLDRRIKAKETFPAPPYSSLPPHNSKISNQSVSKPHRTKRSIFG